MQNLTTASLQAQNSHNSDEKTTIKFVATTQNAQKQRQQ